MSEVGLAYMEGYKPLVSVKPFKIYLAHRSSPFLFVHEARPLSLPATKQPKGTFSAKSISNWQLVSPSDDIPDEKLHDTWAGLGLARRENPRVMFGRN